MPACGVRLTPKHYAYLKISEGCNHHCTFCVIPNLRGGLVSRPAGEVIREARNLVDAGVKELLVISQDTAAYGVDRRYALDLRANRRCARICSTSAGAWASSASGRACTTSIRIRPSTRSCRSWPRA